MCISLHGSSVLYARFIPSLCHPRCVFERSLVLVLSFSCFSPSFTLFSSTLPVPCPALQLLCRQRRGLKPLRLRTMRSIAPWRYTIPLTGYEPNVLDDFHYSETSVMIFQDESGDTDGIFVKLISKVFMRWKNSLQFKSYESMSLQEED